MSSHARSERLPCYTDLAAGRGSPCTARRRMPIAKEIKRWRSSRTTIARSERNRVKEAKKQEKLAKREEEVAKRRAARERAGRRRAPEKE